MSKPLEKQLYQLVHKIADTEPQNRIPGDAPVEATLKRIRQTLADPIAPIEQLKEALPDIAICKRMTITLLYKDVVRSTAVNQHLDPEDTLMERVAILAQYIQILGELGGHLQIDILRENEST